MFVSRKKMLRPRNGMICTHDPPTPMSGVTENGSARTHVLFVGAGVVFTPATAMRAICDAPVPLMTTICPPAHPPISQSLAGHASAASVSVAPSTAASGP